MSFKIFFLFPSQVDTGWPQLFIGIFCHSVSLGFYLFDPDTLQFLDPAMLNTYFQQAVSDTAMDIQEAENGIETSKLTDHTYENVNIFHRKKGYKEDMRNMHSSSQATPRPQQQAPQPHLLQRCSEFLLFSWFYKTAIFSKWVKTSCPPTI